MKPFAPYSLLAAVLVAILTSAPAPAANAAAFAAWRAGAVGKVATHKTTPRSAQLRGSRGTAQMLVAVDARGMIVDYRLHVSSGNPILDREADAIMLRVGTFAAPPEGRPSRIIVPIRW